MLLSMGLPLKKAAAAISWTLQRVECPEPLRPTHHNSFVVGTGLEDDSDNVGIAVESPPLPDL